MKKKALIVFTILFLTGSGIFLKPVEAWSHDVNFSIGIDIGSPPPPVVVTGPPALYVIPGTPVYYVNEKERQLFFYSGNWYRLYNGYWFRAVHDNGPWVYLSSLNVPFVFMDLSPRYYGVPPREHYRMHRNPVRYWKPGENRRYEHRDKWGDRHDDHRERGFDGHRNWKDKKTKKRWD